MGRWAAGLGVGLAVGLGLAAIFMDLYANKSCGLLPPAGGMAVLSVAFLGVAALVSVVVANQAAPDTKRLGRWLFVVVVSAAVVFVGELPIATQLVSPGCSLGR